MNKTFFYQVQNHLTNPRNFRTKNLKLTIVNCGATELSEREKKLQSNPQTLSDGQSSPYLQNFLHQKGSYFQTPVECFGISPLIQPIHSRKLKVVISLYLIICTFLPAPLVAQQAGQWTSDLAIVSSSLARGGFCFFYLSSDLLIGEMLLLAFSNAKVDNFFSLKPQWKKSTPCS